MKRKELIKHLERYNCYLVREGARHSIYVNKSGIPVTVPRHPDINDYTAKSICKALEIPVIGHN